MDIMDYNFGPFNDFERLQRQMDELFDRIGFSPRSGTFPAMNIYDEGEDFVVAVLVPGVSKEELGVDLRENVLTVTGTRKPAEYEGATVLRKESPSGDFRRSLRIPGKVKTDSVHAEFKDGTLLIRMPKSEESKPKHIAISA